MKKIILILSFSLVLSSFSIAETWQEKWSEAASYLETANFNEGKAFLDEAIVLMEEEMDLNQPYIYIDRARVNIILGSDKEALSDLEKALSSQFLSGEEKIRALTTKIFLNKRLRLDAAVLEDFKTFKQAIEIPKIEIKEKYIIVRNTPKNDFYKKLMTCYLIHSGVCYDAEELKWLNSNTLLANTHCGCPKCTKEYAKTRECDNCHHIVSPTKRTGSLSDFTLAAIQYIAFEVKQLEDQKACLIALCQINGRPYKMELFPDTFESIFQDVKQPPLFFD